MDRSMNGLARRRISYGSPMMTGFDPTTEAGFSTPQSPIATRLEEDEPDVAFFGPRAYGERQVPLAHYWGSRAAKAAAAFVLVHCLLLLGYRLVAVSVLVSGHLFWAVPYFLAVVLAAASHSSIYLSDYVRRTTVVDTRFAAALDLFTVRGLSEWTRFALGGVLVSWAFAAQLGPYYQGPILFTTELTRDSHTKFLNEEALYVILAGAWTGSYLFLQRHFDVSRPPIKPPIVHRLKFLEFKAKARPTLKKSLQKSLWIATYFTFAYHFFLYDFKHTVVAYSLFLDSCTLEIDRSWYQLFNLRRFLVMYLSCALTLFSFRMAKIFMKMFLLAPQNFDVVLYHEEQSDLSLSEALADNRLPLIRVLAFQCLLRICEGRDAESKSRRKMIFSLSPPSDVAAEWEAVKGDCLAVLSRFSGAFDELRDVADVKQPDAAVPTLPLNLAMQWMRGEARRERMKQQLQAMTVAERLAYKSRRLVDDMPGLKYVFNLKKQNAFSRLVRDSGEMLSACQVLSRLVAASVDEDRYGVVQRDVPQIVAALVALKTRLAAFDRVSPLCKGYAISVHRCLVRIWLTFPDSFGREGLKNFM